MRDVNVITLLAFVAQVHAKHTHNSMDKLAQALVHQSKVQILVDNVLDNLFDKALNSESRQLHADLDSTMLAKPGHVAKPGGLTTSGFSCQPLRRKVTLSCHIGHSRPGHHVPLRSVQVVSASTLQIPRHAEGRSLPKLSTQLKEDRRVDTQKKKKKKDEEVSLLVQSLRGANLNDDDACAEDLQMRLVGVKLVGVNKDDDLPLHYDPAALKAYFSKRPGALLERSLQVSSATSGFVARLALDKVQGHSSDPNIQTKRAAELRALMTSLGPFFIKLGQSLSIRPDILPAQAMVELQKLCDKVPPFDSKVAMEILTDELGASPDEIFSELTAQPVAAASLGQVYKGRLRTTGEVVAVKVQRPFVLETVSLDLHLMRELGLKLRSSIGTKERTDLVKIVDEFAGRFYDELDYRIECKNGIRIAKALASLPKVLIPKCFPKYTSRRVLTTEWVEGEKLAQSKAGDVLDLVNVGVVAYLTQLLGEGFFHADPHPGNMIRTPDGRLCILDFGLMTELTDDQKFGMIEAIVHLINRDYELVGDDFKKLGFIPNDADAEPIVPALANVFNAALAGGGAKNINFNDLAADLAAITLEHPFRIPPYFALVIRAIGVLEGIALVGNPQFAIVDEAYPYISQRLLTDKNPRLRAALRYMVYGRDGVFDAEHLIDMLSAFEKFDVVRHRAGGVAFAASDEPTRRSAAMAFFFSRDGKFFREFLLDETVRGVDVLSRSALMRLPELVPGPAGAALQSARMLTPAPLRALVPDLTLDEEKVLRSTTALLDFFLGQHRSHSNAAPALATQRSLAPVGGTRYSVNEALQFSQGLRPVVQQYSDAMRDFGFQIVSHLAELYTERAMKYTLTFLQPQSFTNHHTAPSTRQTTSSGRTLDKIPQAALPSHSSLPALHLSVNNMNGNGRSAEVGHNWQERKHAQRVLKTSESVKNDINSILRIEPNWAMYSKDLKLIDPGGTVLSLGKVKQLLGIVRRFIGTFIEKEDVAIKSGFLDSADPILSAEGTIKLRGCGLPLPAQASFNLIVAGSCKIYFDGQGHVSEVDVDSWSFNGRAIKLPKLDDIDSDNLSPQDTIALLGWTREALFGR